MISILYLCFVFESNVIASIRDKCIHSPSAIKRFIYWISLLLLYVIIPWGIGSVTILLIKPYIDQPTTNNPGISIAILAIILDGNSQPADNDGDIRITLGSPSNSTNALFGD